MRRNTKNIMNNMGVKVRLLGAMTLASTVRSLHEACVGTRELMNNGTNTYVEVLKAQEDLLSAQITEVENRYEGIQALINLYNALGGF